VTAAAEAKFERMMLASGRAYELELSRRPDPPSVSAAAAPWPQQVPHWGAAYTHPSYAHPGHARSSAAWMNVSAATTERGSDGGAVSMGQRSPLGGGTPSPTHAPRRRADEQEAAAKRRRVSDSSLLALP
jgi:hypothetical protein